MKELGIRFTVYDFLGYFIPGFIVLVLWFFRIELAEANMDGLTDKAFIFFKETDTSTLLFCSLIAYVTGYINGVIAQLVLEKWLVESLAANSIDHIQKVCPKPVYHHFMELYEKTYGFSFLPQNRRHLITFTCQYNAALYERVFLFITTAAQSRAFTFICLIFTCLMLLTTVSSYSTTSLFVTLTGSMVTLLFFNNYLHFKRRYIREAILGFVDYHTHQSNLS